MKVVGLFGVVDVDGDFVVVGGIVGDLECVVVG